MNILNPALTARAFLFFAYPTKMTGNEVWINTTLEKGQKLVDGLAEPLPWAMLLQGLQIKFRESGNHF